MTTTTIFTRSIPILGRYAPTTLGIGWQPGNLLLSLKVSGAVMSINQTVILEPHEALAGLDAWGDGIFQAGIRSAKIRHFDYTTYGG